MKIIRGCFIYMVIQITKSSRLFIADKFYIRVNDLFCISKKGTVRQALSENFYKEIDKNDYYKNKGILSRKIVRLTNEAMKDTEKFEGACLVTNTNEMFYKLIEKQDCINIEIVKNSEKSKSQPCEKLEFINIDTFKKNINNKEFWEFIFKKEVVRKYKITLKDRGESGEKL